MPVVWKWFLFVLFPSCKCLAETAREAAPLCRSLFSYAEAGENGRGPLVGAGNFDRKSDVVIGYQRGKKLVSILRKYDYKVGLQRLQSMYVLIKGMANCKMRNMRG